MFRFDLTHDFKTSITEKLGLLHERINGSTGAIDRIACALYNPEAGTLEGLISSATEQMRRVPRKEDLSGTTALYRLAARRTCTFREIPANIVTSPAHAFSMPPDHEGSSYSFPLFHRGGFVGFVFFYSRSNILFDASTRATLPIYATMVGSLIGNELKAIEAIIGAIRLARRFCNLRTGQTGNHTKNSGRYSRLIAERLMGSTAIDYDFIERLFLFAPLHDIGNTAIPDHILLKPGALSGSETEIMRQHVIRGRELTEQIIEDFDLEQAQYISILRNIVELHHERMDGSGYPYGLRDEQIPLEARIMAVADVFEALISVRPYKAAWRTDQAFEELEALGKRGKLDPKCIAVLTGAQAEIDTIRNMQNQSDSEAGTTAINPNP